MAGILLNTAFTRHYPQFEWARLKRDCVGAEGCWYWRVDSWTIFNEYGYCEAVSGFNLAYDQIRAHNQPRRTFSINFNLDPVEYENHHFEKRDGHIKVLIGLAEGDYIPALLKIGELLQRGDVFVRSTEAEYYVLKRACFLGYAGCSDLKPRLIELQEALAPDRIALIEQGIRSDFFAVLSLRGLLIDGTLQTSVSH
ncbi:MAG: hypothetical protein JKX99_03815 [Robiginitomaculum sp.]|nr:hypothetical protein [Robiginitomaculum sp.]